MTPHRPASGRMRRGYRTFVRFLHAFTGEGAHADYVAHAQRAHPGEPVLDRREFWRERYADADENLDPRCC